MKVNVQDLSGAALDWAVEITLGTLWDAQKQEFTITRGSFSYSDILSEWPYSIDAIAALPIIEKDLISVKPMLKLDGTLEHWLATKMNGIEATGPTLLVAAMRCYIKMCFASGEVDVPNKVMQYSY